MKKTTKAKTEKKKLAVKVATVRPLRDSQIGDVAGGLMKTYEPSGTPANC